MGFVGRGRNVLMVGNRKNCTKILAVYFCVASYAGNGKTTSSPWAGLSFPCSTTMIGPHHGIHPLLPLEVSGRTAPDFDAPVISNRGRKESG